MWRGSFSFIPPGSFSRVLEAPDTLRRLGIFAIEDVLLVRLLGMHIMKTVHLLTFGLAAALALSSGSAMAKSNGEKLFKRKCSTCHSLEPDKFKVGPSLYKIMGRKAGSTNFPKYKALRGATFTWDETSIDGWITNPKKFIGKSTAMTVKVKKPEDRAAIIQYLSGAED